MCPVALFVNPQQVGDHPNPYKTSNPKSPRGRSIICQIKLNATPRKLPKPFSRLVGRSPNLSHKDRGLVSRISSAKTRCSLEILEIKSLPSNTKRGVSSCIVLVLKREILRFAQNDKGGWNGEGAG